MEEKKTKKKLTLSVSSKAKRSSSHYTQSKGKTSVVIEKKLLEDGLIKNFKHEMVTLIKTNQVTIYLKRKHQ